MKNRARNWWNATWLSMLFGAALQGCAALPVCDKPTAFLYDNFLLFDQDNAVMLAKVMLELSAGKCRIESDA